VRLFGISLFLCALFACDWSQTRSLVAETGDADTASGSTDTSLVPGSDTGPPTATVTYWAYEHDRDCWSIREVERPSEYWQHWEDQDCGFSVEEERTYWIEEPGNGHCGQFATTLDEGSCAVDDPTGWIGFCDPVVHPCCAEGLPDEDGIGAAVPQCFPNPYYEP
jgi:hypothetical protein